MPRRVRWTEFCAVTSAGIEDYFAEKLGMVMWKIAYLCFKPGFTLEPARVGRAPVFPGQRVAFEDLNE